MKLPTSIQSISNPFLLWLLIVNIVTLFLWRFGPAIFFICLLSTFLLTHYVILEKSTPTISDKCYKALIPLSILTTLIVTYYSFGEFLNYLVDIGLNANEAIEVFMRGDNPYTTRTQMWAEHIDPSDNLTKVDDQYYMFGIPYSYGFPYLPAMMFGYFPFRLAIDHQAAIKVANIVFSLANLLLVLAMLKQHILNAEQLQRARKIAFVVLFLMPCYYVNMYLMGVTDILITTLMLFSLYALGFKKIFLAGFILGIAQACKILPAPFLLLAIFLWLPLLREKATFLLGFSISSLAIVIPFIIWDYEGFLSATILFYLTHHGDGDKTGLWFYLPTFLQSIFSILAPLLSFIYIVYFTKKSQGNLIKLSAVCFSAYPIFIAFSKMSHLNYYWGVYPIAAIGLAYAFSKKSNNST